MRNGVQTFAAFNWPTVTEVCELTGWSRSHTLRLIASGELAACDISSKGSKRPTYHVDPASVDAFRKRRMRGAPAK